MDSSQCGTAGGPPREGGIFRLLQRPVAEAECFLTADDDVRRLAKAVECIAVRLLYQEWLAQGHSQTADFRLNFDSHVTEISIFCIGKAKMSGNLMKDG